MKGQAAFACAAATRIIAGRRDDDGIRSGRQFEAVNLENRITPQMGKMIHGDARLAQSLS